jgi:hypothetical protein
VTLRTAKPNTIFAAGAAALLILSLAVFQIPGLAGMTLGLASGTFGAVVLWGTVKLMKDASSFSKIGITLILLGFFLKFPILGGAGYLSYLQGWGALACFVFGVVVVYSALVWRALRSDLF